MPAVWCPFAERHPLPEADSQPLRRTSPKAAIFHTMVGFLRSTDHFFRTRTGIESHFGLGGPFDGPDLDGVLWQWVPLNRTADANFHANPWAVSIETSDNAPGRPEDIVAWSPKQLAALIRWGNWLADEWRVPRRQCPAWDASGFGWHAMWGAPSHWTNVAGKVCPGRRRINQLRTIVFPAIFEGTERDFFMALTDSQQQEILAAARQINQAVGQGQLDYSGTIEAILSTVQQVVNMLGALRQDMTVDGTTGLEQTFEHLAQRQRDILGDLQTILERLPAPPPS
jgi:hypothetical protein